MGYGIQIIILIGVLFGTFILFAVYFQNKVAAQEVIILRLLSKYESLNEIEIHEVCRSISKWCLREQLTEIAKTGLICKVDNCPEYQKLGITGQKYTLTLRGIKRLEFLERSQKKS
jgi:DNA-binding HxlR family transcriptional regulator